MLAAPPVSLHPARRLPEAAVDKGESRWPVDRVSNSATVEFLRQTLVNLGQQTQGQHLLGFSEAALAGPGALNFQLHLLKLLAWQKPRFESITGLTMAGSYRAKNS